MRYLILLILLFFFFKPIQSQDKRKLINGEVRLDSIPIHDVHIVNLKSNIGTVTNDTGSFNLPVRLGDSISISHINLKNLIVTITKKNMSSLKLTINLTEQVTALQEFTLEKPRSIFEQDKDIMIYKGPTINAQTLNLPYANTKPKIDNTTFKIRSGAVVNLDNLLNAFNGNNKRAKVLKKITLEDERLLNIRKYFTDDFFITDLQIKQELINSFLNFCLKQNIIYLFNKKDHLRLTQILLKESKSFQQKENFEVKLALKKN
ncbi:hypothetical protein CW731_02055 [Polaribacter sp. ALD11]|uniref:hypothetical protein n=1 Tax=Polaribacter sp. ALD11 TaxID=2058137 RepID=UPI000C305F78|nr:hypothetical protein [Polaribacter sp. ALD11]AUC84153.1 hypothetical protein CW731_02055 [Polaribacter sp. ALD11]